MTKKEIVKQISEKLSVPQLTIKEIVQLTFDSIIDTLIQHGRIELRNFGVFEVKKRKGRDARNPRSGEKVKVPPKVVVTFKPGKEMEELVRAKAMADDAKLQENHTPAASSAQPDKSV